MAKRDVKEKMMFEAVLPQNILPVGERVEEDKNIYISQKAYKEIHEFTKNKTKVESGGMLVGGVVEELGKKNIIIQGFIEAKYAEGTPTTLKFTHETWDYVHKRINDEYSNCTIVGWIHTHPDFGIFLSDYDKFIQENFFKEDYQIAYVVDPIQHIEGFYFWINGKIERCKGFYIFDKTGEQIIIEADNPKNPVAASNEKNQSLHMSTIIIASVLGAVIIALLVVGINLMNRMKILESRQENLVESANQSIESLQQQIYYLNGEIGDLQEQISVLGQEDETESIVDAEQNSIFDQQMDSSVQEGANDAGLEKSDDEGLMKEETIEEDSMSGNSDGSSEEASNE